MTDPRKDERERHEHPEQHERVKLGLSPTDDDLPRGLAIRLQEERKQAAQWFRDHKKDRSHD